MGVCSGITRRSKPFTGHDARCGCIPLLIAAVKPFNLKTFDSWRPIKLTHKSWLAAIVHESNEFRACLYVQPSHQVLLPGQLPWPQEPQVDSYSWKHQDIRHCVFCRPQCQVAQLYLSNRYHTSETCSGKFRWVAEEHLVCLHDRNKL